MHFYHLAYDTSFLSIAGMVYSCDNMLSYTVIA